MRRSFTFSVAKIFSTLRVKAVNSGSSASLWSAAYSGSRLMFFSRDSTVEFFTAEGYSLFCTRSNPINISPEEEGKYLKNLETEQIRVTYLPVSDDFAKGTFIKSAFSNLAVQKDAPELLGFMDYSYKISILEIIPMLDEILDQPEKITRAVEIGSRQHDLSEVINKSEALQLRSMMLNMLVKSLFPLLYKVQDTQTGLKIIGRDMWQDIDKFPWVTTGYGFDIELLQKIVRYGAKGVPIKEKPVSFFDNTETLGINSGEKIIWNVFSELLKVRGAITDGRNGNRGNHDLHFFSGGADRMIFEFTDVKGSERIMKIPNDNFDLDYYMHMKYLLMPDRKIMRQNEHGNRLAERNVLNALSSNSLITRTIPLLRTWPEFNSFMLRTIALIENKDYKSIGYPLAFDRGAGLVIPMARQTAAFSIKYNAKKYHFLPEDNVLLAEKADVVRNRLNKLIVNDDFDGYQELLEQMVDLMKALWRRGLFDMDTNIIADLGFYRDKLYLLDPGELINNPDSEMLRYIGRRLNYRTDYIELKGMLMNTDADQAKYRRAYLSKMTELLKYMRADLQKAETDREFASDLGKPGQYALSGSQTLPRKKDTLNYKNSVQHALFLAGAGVQKKYPINYMMPKLTYLRENNVEYFVNKNRNLNDSQVQQVLQSEELQKPLAQNTFFAMQGGRGYRTKLLGLAAGGKENIFFDGETLMQHVFAGLAPLRDLQSASDDRLVIISADDNLMYMQPHNVEQIDKYFARPESPGFFFYDLPEEDNIMPNTLEDMVEYFQHSKIFWDDFRAFCRSIPPIAGYMQQKKNLPEVIVRSVLNNYETLLNSKKDASIEGIRKLPFMNEAYNIIKRFIIYSANRKTGLKTPYLFIAKQSFLNDLRQRVDIPNYAGAEINWFTLRNALKYDNYFWQMIKPKLMSSADWQAMRTKLQDLAKDHNVDVHDAEQNDSRVFRGQWAPLDGPWYNIVKLIKRNGVTYDEHGKNENGSIFIENMYSDVNIPPKIDNCENNDAIVIGDPAQIKGSIIIEGDFRSKQSKRKNVFYQIYLPADKTLVVPKNHLLVRMPDKEYYSMTMQPLSKYNLGQAMVFKYEPSPEDPDKYIAKPYKLYDEFFKIWHPLRDKTRDFGLGI
ncbi:putative glycosyl transferase [Candidatus Termititenax spirochaetophilus]|uniref:Glycosyl transferase n=1 Tax=Candidatus Termititenax spirochaetophilus TaxID=2218522 RepID=A0A388T857_9BACT|nr:putative glycosyl transferase [Candidatus Termititenax spirochaetophilus]